MTYRQLSNLVIESLKLIYDEREARSIQRYLFNGLNDRNLTDWLIINDNEADIEFQNKVLEAIPELKLHKPIQYIIGTSWFYNMKFQVTENVLIPRPETEQLVKMIINEAKSNRESINSVLDLGTGSGVIAVTLSKFLNASKVIAVDISEKAIEIAESNAKVNNTNITFIIQDILQINSDTEINKELNVYFDIIVSNPPYIKNSEAELMSKNVLNFEPHTALFVSDQNPLLYYNSIIDFAIEHLSSKGILWFEINESEGMNLLGLMKSKGLNPVLFNDFNEKPRFISARRKNISNSLTY